MEVGFVLKKFLKLKHFLLGVLATVIVFSLISGAFAAVGGQSIQIEFNNIKLVIDGKPVTPKDGNGNQVEPFTYNGTTYLPVRAIANALGKEVNWDAGTSTVYLGNMPSVSKASYSRENPAPIGATQDISIKNYSQDYSTSISINRVTRGAAAWQLINSANMFNPQPEAGYEYIVVNATMTVTLVGNSKAVRATYMDFQTFSSTNVEYTNKIVVSPTPIFNADLYAGGSITGNFVVTVNSSDAKPKIVYGRDYDGSGGIWFALY